MPGKILPTYTEADVRGHNSAKSCYVTLGSKVYDVTEFLDDHPGGGDLILEYAGTDVKEIMADVVSHRHSEAAFEILEDYHIGFVASETGSKGGVKEAGTTEGSRPVYVTTGMGSEHDLTVETDFATDYRTHKFLDLSKPLFPQLWYGGFTKEFYLDQVHRPRHYKGGDSAPLFGNFLEPLSKTPWYIVPIIWLPPITYTTMMAAAGLNNTTAAAAYWLFGLFLWTLVEYVLHRFLFHIDKYAILTSSLTASEALTAFSDGFRITGSGFHCIFFCMASTIICRWTGIAWSCRPHCS
jgi:4-hydroxysphinganine ceramide fatty acyl 2-hydroxylase